MARLYLENEIQRIINEAYKRGWEDAKSRRDATPTPPDLREITVHPRTGGPVGPQPPPTKAGT